MRPADVEPLIDIGAASLWGPVAPAIRPRQFLRIAHFLGTDPGGAWTAEHDGVPVGCALAIVREGLWGLSLLMLDERHRGRGAGRALVEASLAYGADAPNGIVLSSEHPAAMRLYATAGFELRPCVAFGGMVTSRPRVPDVVREGTIADAAWMDDVARTVRGAAYGPDLERWLADDARLRCVEGRGWMVTRGSEVKALLALDDEAGTALIEAFLAEARETVEVLFLTAGQDWAVRAGLAAGLVLSPEGPVFTRGGLGTLRPWIPSGAYL